MRRTGFRNTTLSVQASAMLSFAIVAGLVVVLIVSCALGGHIGCRAGMRELPEQPTRPKSILCLLGRIENLAYVVLIMLSLLSVIARLVLVFR